MLEGGKYANLKNVGTWIVNNADREAGEAVTHLKLQKLLYYVEAWFLANFDRPLFEESVQAWTHGPVYRSIYDKYKGSSWDALPLEKGRNLEAELSDFVSAVYSEYGQFSAKKLEIILHSEDPWKKTRGNLPLEARCDTPIDKLFIRNYYADRIGKEKINQLSN